MEDANTPARGVNGEELNRQLYDLERAWAKDRRDYHASLPEDVVAAIFRMTHPDFAPVPEIAAGCKEERAPPADVVFEVGRRVWTIEDVPPRPEKREEFLQVSVDFAKTGRPSKVDQRLPKEVHEILLQKCIEQRSIPLEPMNVDNPMFSMSKQVFKRFNKPVVVEPLPAVNNIMTL
jgi:hypothetical protein